MVVVDRDQLFANLIQYVVIYFSAFTICSVFDDLWVTGFELVNKAGAFTAFIEMNVTVY